MPRSHVSKWSESACWAVGSRQGSGGPKIARRQHAIRRDTAWRDTKALGFRICRPQQRATAHTPTAPLVMLTTVLTTALETDGTGRTQRTLYPGLEWHTLGGQFNDSRAFWAAVGAGVPGGYQQRDVCAHITPGG